MCAICTAPRRPRGTCCGPVCAKLRERVTTQRHLYDRRMQRAHMDAIDSAREERGGKPLVRSADGLHAEMWTPTRKGVDQWPSELLKGVRAEARSGMLAAIRHVVRVDGVPPSVVLVDLSDSSHPWTCRCRRAFVVLRDVGGRATPLCRKCAGSQGVPTPQ